MRRRAFSGLLVATLVTLTGAACDDNSGTPIDPSPTPTVVNETFSGILTVNGGVTFPFASNAAGAVTARLIALTDGAAIGMAVGTSTGTTCTAVLADDNAGFGSTIFGAVQGAGSLCLRVYDVGKMTGSVTFTVDVEHY